MNFFNRIFRRNMVDCPRCLGKGKVSSEDIKRLKMELFWAPGRCAYCNGIGKVPAGRAEKLDAGLEYLTTDIPSWERHRVINGDGGALKRAGEFKEVIQKIIEEIEHLYYIENQEPNEIADHLFHKKGKFVYSAAEKQEVIEYIQKVIKTKLKN